MPGESVGVYIPDPFYGRVPESPEEEKVLTDNFKAGLEAEYSLGFEFANIRTGAALPAYFATFGVLSGRWYRYFLPG